METSSKHILVDIGHPAHVHLFRNAIKAWQVRGHQVVITTRDKDVSLDLLNAYGLPYQVVSKARRGTLGLAYEMLEHDLGVLKEAVRSHSKILIGTSVSITHVAPFIGATSVVFNEDDASVAKSFVRLSYPFAHKIVTPTVLNEDYGRKHITYKGYQKLAYLHPTQFTPDPRIKERLGVGEDEPYFLMRFVSHQAAHDQGEFGMGKDLRLKLIDLLSKNGKVFITSESPLQAEFTPYQIDVAPEDMLNVLAFASTFIGDSQSMSVEAAILGVPSLRINSFANRCTVLQELQNKYELNYSFFPSQEQEIFRTLKLWLEDDRLSKKWQDKRQQMLSEKINVTPWMVDLIDNLPVS